MKMKVRHFSVIPLLLCLFEGVNAEVYIVRTKSTELSTASVQGDVAAYYESMVAAASGPAGDESTTLDAPPSGPAKKVVIQTYENVMTGFAASLTSTQVANLRNLPEVVGVFLDRVHHTDTTHTPELLGLKSTKGLWPETDYGKDVIIGVLDTGVWPESASFGAQGLGPIPTRWKGRCVTGASWTAKNCNQKLIGARYYYAGYEANLAESGKTIDWTKEYKSARDIEGHGTHTASTAGGRVVTGASFFGIAKGTAQGMAPKSRLAIYKICWLGGCFDSDILAAFDQAVADGVDVISLSVGSTAVSPYYEAGIPIGAYGAAKRGIFVSASAGNSGPGYFSVRNIPPWITTVGAATVDRDFFLNVRLGNGKTITGQSFYNGKALVAGNTPMILGSSAAKSNVTESYLCYPDSLDPTKVKNKVVLCHRGGDYSRLAKGQSVLQAGGAGMIIVNFADTDPIDDLHVLPATMVSSSDGAVIANYINSTPKPIARLLLPTITKLGVKPAPAVADFSSRGPNKLTSQLLKPDLVAPGAQILAAWPPVSEITGLANDNRRSNFNIISGTSMACPHISGLGALLKAKHPTWSPSAIRSALMTTATFLDNSGSVITDVNGHLAATPNEFGAGMVQPEKAADPGLLYDLSSQDYESFLCASKLTRNQILSIDSQAKPCPAKPIRIEDFNYPSFSAYFYTTASTTGSLTTTFTRTVTNVGSARSSYTASFTKVPRGYKLSVKPSTLVFTKKNEKKSFTLTVTVPAAPVPDSGFFGFEYAFLRWSDQTHVVQSPIVVYKETK